MATGERSLLLEQWQQQPALLDDHGLGLQRVIAILRPGTPIVATSIGLNRSFQQDRLMIQAIRTMKRFGPVG